VIRTGFDGPRDIRAFTGLVPTVSQSGDTEHHGPPTLAACWRHHTPYLLRDTDGREISATRYSGPDPHDPRWTSCEFHWRIRKAGQPDRKSLDRAMSFERLCG
jgi:hypothetical protein